MNERKLKDSTHETARLLHMITDDALYNFYVRLTHEEMLEKVRGYFETPSQADAFADNLANRIENAVIDIYNAKHQIPRTSARDR